MKYIKHILILALVMVMANTWAQNSDPTIPTRMAEDKLSWTFNMPAGNRMLRANWKQDAGLAYDKSDTTVYLGFTFMGQELTNPHNIPVTYSIVPQTGTNSGNTINNAGVVTINGIGIDTVKAIFAGNDTLLPDTAMYIINSRALYTLTLATNDNTMGTVTLVGTPAGVTDNNDGTYTVIDGTQVTVSATVTATPAENFHFVNWTDGNSNVIGTDEQITITVTGDTTVKGNFDRDFEGTGTEDDPYLIPSIEKWNLMATRVKAGNSYEGKYFRQTADFYINSNTSSVGTGTHPFCGTYDGQGHSIRISSDWPFYYVNGATIKNLHITGNNHRSQFASGLIYRLNQSDKTTNIINCRSSVEIKSGNQHDFDGTHGGFVGVTRASINFIGCVFDGKFVGQYGPYCRSNGGFIGWTEKEASVHFKDCIFAPEIVSMGDSLSCTFSRARKDTSLHFTNCYYTQAYGTEQGKQMDSITAGEYVTSLAFAGVDTVYNVSGITAYANNMGLKYGDKFYAGNGDVVELSLSYADRTADGFLFNTYSASNGGIINGTTLTMPDTSTVINANYNSLPTLTLASNDAQMGTVEIVTPLPSGVTVKDANAGEYYVVPGTEVTVKATANTDHYFADWNDQNTDNPRTVTVTSDTAFTANFAADEYRLDSVHTTWEVYLNNATTPIYPTAYSTNNTMGYVMIPIGADVVITPQPTEQTELVSRLAIKLAGILDGMFSVSSTKKVQFSQGNLQAITSDKGTTWTWAFATNQWDYVGNNAANNSVNGNGKVSTNGPVDLFGWSTSSTYYGIHNSTNNGTYSGNFANWGVAAISNGGGVANFGWSTPSRDEWVYVFNTRASGSTVNGVSNARYTHATINTDGTSVNGIMLFPDGITIANSEATSWGTVNGGSSYGTKCTIAQWTALAAKGCVFLPSAGVREGSTVKNLGTDGAYWSSTPYNAQRSYLANFYSNGVNPQPNYGRFHGYSVRLVKVPTVTTTPVRCGTDNYSWCFQMPKGNHVLRTYWKQDAGLAYAKSDTTVYLGFNFTGQELTNPHNIPVTYSIAPQTGTNSGNTINNAGVVTINGIGIDTVKAIFAGNDTLLPDTAMYIINSRAPYTLTLASNDNTMGTVALDGMPAGVTIKDANAGEYYVVPGTEVTVKATASTGHLFEDWTNENNNVMGTDAQITLTITGDTTVRGNFALKTYTVRVVGTPNRDYGSAQITDCAQCHEVSYNPNTNIHEYTVNHGDNITIEATAETGHHFAAWEGGITATTNPLEIVIDRDTTISAYFEVNIYSVTANSEGNGSVEISGAGVTTDGQHGKYGGPVTFTATPDAGYRFVQWNDGNTDNPRDTIIHGEVHLTATFGLSSPGLTPEGELTTTGNRFVDEHGQIVGSPRINQYGEIIAGGGTPTSVSSITVSKGSSGLSSDKVFYYVPGESYRDAINNNPENKLTGGYGWFYWENGVDQATIYYKEPGKQKDMSIDGNQHFGPGQTITLDSVVDPTGHTYIFVD